MQNITFIRHSQLAPPFNDYSKLSFSQIANLASGRVDPSIVDDTEFIKSKFDRANFNEVDYILHSPFLRAKQTARIIKSFFKNTIPCKEEKLLTEIYFDPVIITDENLYNQKGISEIRKSLLQEVVAKTKNKNAEHITNLIARIEQLKKNIELMQHKNILCITHSFFMRVLRLYFVEGYTNPAKISYEKLHETIDHKYVEGFTVTI